MNPTPVYIKKIIQKDNYTFTIEWNDGISNDYRLSLLQKNCPCANCTDEITGKRMSAVTTVLDDVRAVRINSVGRYAMRIQFTFGCSAGIYSYDMLREFAKNFKL